MSLLDSFDRGSVLIVFLTNAAYLNCLMCGLVFDDMSAIVTNSDLRSNESSILDLFAHDFWGTPISLELSHKSYRPLTVLTFRLNYSLHELNALGYHFVNMILHTIVTLLFHRLASKVILKSEKVAMISSILFALHPIHTEAVTGVVGRAELLAALFYFLAFDAYISSRLLLFCTFSICSLLSKEQGITILGVCFIYEITRFKPWPSFQWNHFHRVSDFHIFRSLVIIFLGIGAISLRVWIMGGINKLPVFTKYDNPASFARFPIRHLTFNYLLYKNINLLLYPYPLCCDWTMKSIPLIESIYDSRNICTFGFYLLAFFLIRKIFFLFREADVSQASTLTVILSMIVLPFLPASNLFIPVGFVIAERILYLPSAGFCLLLAYGYQNLSKRSIRLHKLLNILFTLTVLFFTLKVIHRNTEWTDELKLFSSGIKINPMNAKLYNNIGHFYEKRKDWKKAIEYFAKAKSIQPDDLGASINIARTLINMGEASKAEQIMWQIKPKVKEAARLNSKRIIPSYLSLWINLGNVIAQNVSRLYEAEEVYLELISMRSDFVEAYINLGDVLIKQNRVDDAIQVYQKALQFQQKTGDLYYNLGVAHSLLLQQRSEKGSRKIKDSVALSIQIQKIATYFEHSLEYNNANKEALLNLAIMIQKYPSILKGFKRKVMERMVNYVGPDAERIWFNLALLFSDDADNRTAEYYFRKAICKKPDFRSALFNLALILIDEQRLFEAELYLTQLIQYHPTHVKSLLLLGDIYIEFNELHKAEEVIELIKFMDINCISLNSFNSQCYASVLQQNKSNVEALHNLCVVFTKQNKTEEAQSCYRDLKTIAPDTQRFKIREKQ
ncbi:transmembrane and TPR repeat-containing protein CG4050-like protein [Dinothrombium tinctorium]|uniref:dolichyl-phosphate-mannose--protein mannosyltransferase n=1 Tax=Dinothrombium tinctorium TaxID=1965070 RepID=A0A443QQU5_9ACAR|nr:transmembrane and TPR repeat-containing protein CG4050-like protein [Dinothrombium tinctorium]